MNHYAFRLFAMTMTAAALAVSTAQANPQKWLGENVPFDAAADEPQSTFEGHHTSEAKDSRIEFVSSKWLGENVPSDGIVTEEPTYVAFESDFPTDETQVAGLMLDLPADYFGETAGFPAMPDYVVDEPILIAGLDPTQTP